MPDLPEIPEPAPDSSPHTTPGSPTEESPAATVAAVAPAPRPEPSVADTARLLSKHFPALFGEGVIKPIKLRIQADIHQRAPGVFTKKALSVFLQRHTTGTGYLRALIAEGATRIDLDGHPAGEVSAEHRHAAGVELERRRAIVEAKVHAGREAARGSRHEAEPRRPPRPPRPPLGSQQSDVPRSTSPAAGERPATRNARSVQPGTPDRPQRSPRPSKPGQAPQRARPPQAGVQGGAGRPGETGSGMPRRPHRPPTERSLARAHEQEPVTTPALPLTPEQAAEAEARRQRALLLRSFEQSPLSKANFGALKGLSEATLDELLTLARQERGSR